jgi:hypothetical protein
MDLGEYVSPELIPSIEYDGHTVWAIARTLRHELSKCHPDQVAAVKAEYLESADMIRAAFEVEQ